MRKSPDPEKLMDTVRRFAGLHVGELRMADTITGYGVAESLLQALEIIGRTRPDVDECLTYISTQLRSTVCQTLELSIRDTIPPRQAAIRVAEANMSS